MHMYIYASNATSDIRVSKIVVQHIVTVVTLDAVIAINFMHR